MTQFIGFSEAARLYASNFDVVCQMENAYKKDVSACLEAIELEIQRKIAPEGFVSYETKGGYRYWWLGKERSRETAPYLWFANNPNEIDHARLILWGGSDDGAVAEALRTLSFDSELSVERTAGSQYKVFCLRVLFEGDDFVVRSASRIGDVLKVMSLAISQSKPSRKRG